LDHSLSYFKTCNSDDSACEAKESCGKLHHFAKKKAFLKGRLSNASNCADAALELMTGFEPVTYALPKGV